MICERYLSNLMEEKRSVPVLSWILAGMSFFYRLGISLRNKGYDRGWFQTHSVKAPVVSIGNISVGGTGKTPLVQMIASELEGMGKSLLRKSQCNPPLLRLCQTRSKNREPGSHFGIRYCHVDRNCRSRPCDLGRSALRTNPRFFS